MSEPKRSTKTKPRRKASADSFAAALCIARTKQGITKAEMARRYGAAPTVISRIESGRCKLGEATIRRYAAVLGKSVRLVFTSVKRKPRGKR